MVCPVLTPANSLTLQLENKLTLQKVRVHARLHFDTTGEEHPLGEVFSGVSPPGLFEDEYRAHALVSSEACGIYSCPQHERARAVSGVMPIEYYE